MDDVAFLLQPDPDVSALGFGTNVPCDGSVVTTKLNVSTVDAPAQSANVAAPSARTETAEVPNANGPAVTPMLADFCVDPSPVSGSSTWPVSVTVLVPRPLGSKVTSASAALRCATVPLS